MRPAPLLSAYWFVVLGGLGTFFPFYSLYLNENAGLDGSQVGIVMAVIPLVGMIVQPLWGQVADRTGSRTRVLAILSAGAACGYAALFPAREFLSILAATTFMAIFASAVIPACVAVSFALLEVHEPFGFALVRAWGTIGFLVAVVLFPELLDRYATDGTVVATSPPAQVALGLMFPVSALCHLIGAALAWRLPSRGSVARRSERGAWRLLVRHGPFVRLLFFTFASYLFLQGPILLFPLYVRSLGGTVETVSLMWVCMLALEIPLVALSGVWFRRFGGRTLLGIGIASGAVRWLVSAFNAPIGIVYAAQLLHGVTVGGLMVGAPIYAEAVVPDRLRATAQGALSMVGGGLGGILSTLAAGYLVERAGPTAPALVGGLGALALTLGLPWLVPRAVRAARASAPRLDGISDLGGT
jgi:PPP family 3-phenylpropionic acid transporter